MAWKDRKILLTGAGGFLGSHVADELKKRGYKNVVTASRRTGIDLREQAAVRDLLRREKPEGVMHLAGLIGGILANKEKPADFLYDNLIMGTVMLHESHAAGAAKFMSCIGGCSYPAKAASPIREDTLWEGYPQAESAPYSLGKAMITEQAKAYRRQHKFNAVILVPGNMYGPRDNFDLYQSHVIPALIRKTVEAREKNAPSIPAWGTGRALRDFVYVEDVASILVDAFESYDGEDIINVSSGREVSIKELTETIADLAGYRGKIEWDPSKPEGQLRKQFDVTRLKSLLKKECPTPLREGLKKTIAWYEKNRS